MQNTYYGRIDGSYTEIGWPYMVLDDYIKGSVDKSIKIFRDEVKELFKEIKKEYACDFRLIKKDINDIKKRLKDDDKIKKISTKSGDKHVYKL